MEGEQENQNTKAIELGQAHLSESVKELQEMPAMRARSKIREVLFDGGAVEKALSESDKKDLAQAIQIISDLPEIKAIDEAVELIRKVAVSLEFSR